MNFGIKTAEQRYNSMIFFGVTQGC